MSYFRVYINPKDDFGNFTGYQEVTSDVDQSSISKISRKLDNNEYDVGVLKYNSFNLSLRNEHGKYSDVSTVQSIFRDKRGGSKIKVNWQIQDYQSICGIAISGKAKITPEVTVFEGILSDDSTRLSIDNQKISFTAISFESIFDEVETPYSSLANGDLFSEALLTVLNQSQITSILTVSASNINVDLDIAIDDVSDLENTTVKEALDSILFASNSVLYIKNSTVYISSRDGQGSSLKTFYGQASNNGIEDIVKISDVSTGRNRVFNLFTWKDTALVSKNSTSIDQNGVRKKEVDFPLITNSSKKQSILDQLKTEFSELKQEMKVSVTMTYESLAIDILSVIKIDYPTVLYPTTIGATVPIYGVSKYGQAYYPTGSYGMTILTSQSFKVLGIEIDTKNQILTFEIKEE